MGDNRPPAYFEGDNLIIRASAIGSSCIAELVWAAQGHDLLPVPNFLQGKFDEGTELEPHVLDLLRKEGWEISGEQREGHLSLPNNTFIRFHDDGIGRPSYRVTDLVVEVKCLSDLNWQKAVKHGVASVIGEYAWQMSSMMYGTHLQGVWVAYNKGAGDDVPEEDRLLFEFVDYAPIKYHQIEERAEEIYRLVHSTEKLQCGDFNNYPCRFMYMRGEEPKEADSSTFLSYDVGHDQLLKEYISYKGQADELKERLDNVKANLLKALPDNTKKFVTEQFEAQVITGKGASSLDYSAMPQWLREEVAKYKKPGKEYRYLKGARRKDDLG